MHNEKKQKINKILKFWLVAKDYTEIQREHIKV